MYITQVVKSMHKRIKLAQAAKVGLICLAVVQFVLQLCVLSKGVEYIVSSLTNDDTYYYLQTAWNTKHLGFVTFDGLHTTNGVQLLWFGVVALLAILVQTKTALLLATLILCFLLNVSCYLVIWKLGEILERPTLSLFIASLWSMQSFSANTYSMGMENSLHAFVFWCVIWQTMVFLIQVHNRKQPKFLGLTIVLILNVWTRLDSAIFSATLYICCIGMLAYSTRNLMSFLQENVRSIGSSSLLAGLGLVVQLAAFWLMGGSLLPVSALVKSSEASWGRGAESLEKLREALILSIPDVLPKRFFPPIVLGLLGLVSLLIVIGVQSVRLCNYPPKKIVTFRKLWYCLLIGFLLYHIAIVGYGIQYNRYFDWYRSPLFIFWIITFSLVANMMEDIIAVRDFKEVSRWALVGFSLLIIATSGLWFAIRASVISHRNNLHFIRYHAALWISENSPPDAIYASWNAGEFGYFSNRTVINLDGLVNSVDYYEHVLRGSLPLKDYLYKNEVDYVVDYCEHKLTLSLPVVCTFPRHKASGKWIRIWQVSPPDSKTLNLSGSDVFCGHWR